MSLKMNFGRILAASLPEVKWPRSKGFPVAGCARSETPAK